MNLRYLNNLSCRRIYTMKHTITNLKKFETLYSELGYSVRYEKGNFNSGYCIVQDRKVVVVNKFFSTESRINIMLEILDKVLVDPQKLSEKSLEFFNKIVPQKADV